MSTENLSPRKPILIVDDEEQFLVSMRLALRGEGINNVLTCTDGQQALGHIRSTGLSAIVLDIMLPDIRGTELLEQVTQICPATPVLMITAVNEAATAVDCMKKGAIDYLVKPFDEERMLAAIRTILAHQEISDENEALKHYLLGSDLRQPDAFGAIVTGNRRMQALFQYVEAIAPTPFPVLITGETGVGKELFAQAIHTLSGRSGACVTVNVAGVDENTFSDTVFGHVRGAFTGAERARAGLIEQAGGGTLFLDEIGDLSIGSQVKLLRVIQNRDYLPLGADIARIADTRIIVATNKSIDELKSAAGFRPDLFHRLRTHHIAIPPLRDRKDDIPLLVDHFLDEAAAILGKPRPAVPPALYSMLNTHDFPGNVRELRSMVFDALSVHQSRTLSTRVFSEHLGLDPDATPDTVNENEPDDPAVRFGSRLPTIRQTVGALIHEALERSNGNQNVASRLLGITPQALSRRLKASRKGA